MTCTHAATEVADACIEHCPICQRAEIERLRAEIKTARCPGGGYNGQPADEEPTVENCLKAGVCGCSFGAALMSERN